MGGNDLLLGRLGYLNTDEDFERDEEDVSVVEELEDDVRRLRSHVERLERQNMEQRQSYSDTVHRLERSVREAEIRARRQPVQTEHGVLNHDLYHSMQEIVERMQASEDDYDSNYEDPWDVIDVFIDMLDEYKTMHIDNPQPAPEEEVREIRREAWGEYDDGPFNEPEDNGWTSRIREARREEERERERERQRELDRSQNRWSIDELGGWST